MASSTASMGDEDEDLFALLDPEMEQIMATVQFDDKTGLPLPQNDQGTDVLIPKLVRPARRSSIGVEAGEARSYVPFGSCDPLRIEPFGTLPRPPDYTVVPKVVRPHWVGPWWVVTHGVAPGIYPTRSQFLQATLGCVRAIYNVYRTTELAVAAFVSAAGRAYGVNICEPEDTVTTIADWKESSIFLSPMNTARLPSNLFCENAPLYARPTTIPIHTAGSIVVFRGKQCGIFKDWLQCARFAVGVDGAVFNAFRTYDEGKGAWAHAVYEDFVRYFW
ncbi:hypothetical protein EIP86_007352 [Pleurotus ostreatoroseus]|nr:hypothetical protein EIP86_007352 [Pleurotus ostreatoroseus]